MRTLHPTLFCPTPEAFWAWGRLGLAAAFAVSLLLVTYLVWNAAELLLYVPVLLLGGVCAWYLFRHPLLNLAVVLGGFALISDFDEGIQAVEVVYGLYYVAFLGHWFGTRLFLYRERLFERAEDRILAFFLAWVVASVGMTILNDGSLGAAASELISLSTLSLYFPIKEVCLRERSAPQVIVGVLLFLGIFTAVRNLFHFQEILMQAAAAWQIVSGRVVTNETFLLLPSLVTLVLMMYARRWPPRAGLLLAFMLFFSSLLVTQSRAYWIDFALGVLVLLVLMDRQRRGRLLLLGLAGGAGVLVLSLVLLGDVVIVVGLGLMDRLASILSASSKDISFINRFYESRAVLELIARNPIVGYGPGVPYSVYDIIDQVTLTKMFAHNGFVMIWFKYGLVGLVALLLFWGRSIWLGLRVFRRASDPALRRLCGLIACTGLIAVFPSANTSVPFYLSDTALGFAILTGWAAGLYQRSQYDARYVPTA